MLDYVIELAVEAAIQVPDAEDSLLDVSYHRGRSIIFMRFWTWYASDEEANPVKGLGIPSLARVLVAERLERLLVDKDFTVAEHLFGLPQYKNLQSQIEMSVNNRLHSPSSEDSGEPSTHGEDDLVLSSYKRKNEVGDYEFSELVIAYEASIFSAAGSAIRVDLFRRQLEYILTSRKITMLKYFWPPVNSGRLCQNFMFPRAGFLVPKFIMPQKRYKLFASRMNTGYTLRDISVWYENDASDDIAMQQAQLEGRRQQEYLLWQMKASDRVKEGRLMMIEEDKRSRLKRYFEMKQERSLLEYRGSEGDQELDKHEYDKLFYDIDAQW
jgi:hypothetical protein